MAELQATPLDQSLWDLVWPDWWRTNSTCGLLDSSNSGSSKYDGCHINILSAEFQLQTFRDL